MFDYSDFIEEEENYIHSLKEYFIFSPSISKKVFTLFDLNCDKSFFYSPFEKDSREPLSINAYLLFQNLFYIDYIDLRIPLFSTIPLITFFNSSSNYFKSVKELRDKGYIKNHFLRSYKKINNSYYVVNCSFSYSCVSIIDTSLKLVVPESFDKYDI